MTTFEFSPIGTIRSPFRELAGMPIQPTGAQDAIGYIDIDPKYAKGLHDLDGFSHIILLYAFHASHGFSLTVTPFMDDTPRGLFATRAPKRPNPIGFSVVELLAVSGTRLDIRGVDILDGTPLLDVKPFVPRFDAPDATRIGWLEGRDGQSETRRADDRFIEKNFS
ncbi:tRNA-Thr(GGU) m(6)t(6)A37 methyltransferase TsaA [Desulfobaculum xiamenense]|uniref:tRNA-Thr(GGU) m(6)t(6)A37 methyltransferase TsaA n=1 Tax=Desulfobaculum xiamenense TaxID=995050 RepID=A0A846QRT9_9BACT|nr:tRNA (N6-threonylcarbamoyladenosine(37)-N6)-methyltransferase TrmO [Desulfobaculum xiamenense]NJB68125.1 tRNA-Thr(GGU) m(6)t(6)A37 methyltransferase TsaA [Desulfobaculum xiamenense]